MKHYPTLRYCLPAVATAALLAACSSTPLPPEQPHARVATPAPAQGAPDTLVSAPTTGSSFKSNAANPRAYRADAAHHIYEQNSTRIFKGRMPPLLYAIGVTQVDIDSRGNVQKINWMRAPTHAPEVVHEIERTIRAGAPYPVPARMGHVTYTDTWLWHKSGKFQLDTLTEGQD
jgi:protein TonB